VELLTTTNEADANRLARDFESSTSDDRRSIGDSCAARRTMVEALDLSQTSASSWPPRGGTQGHWLVASRLVEEFFRPTVLIALEGGQGKGSGRSIAGFDLTQESEGVGTFLLRFGGHRSAAGLTIERDRVLSSRSSSTRWPASSSPRTTSSRSATWTRGSAERRRDSLEALLRHIEPCGVGNPARC